MSRRLPFCALLVSLLCACAHRVAPTTVCSCRPSAEALSAADEHSGVDVIYGCSGDKDRIDGGGSPLLACACTIPAQGERKQWPSPAGAADVNASTSPPR